MPRASTRPMLPGWLFSGDWDDLLDADEVAGTGLDRNVGQQGLDFLAHERLLLEQRLCDAIECDAMLREQANCLLERMVGQPCLLLVAETLRLLGARVVVRAHRPRRDDLGHPVLEHHRAR